MISYPSEHWLDANSLLFKYDPELINQIISQLTPERVVTIISNPKFRENEPESAFNLTDPWFGVRWRQSRTYSFSPLSAGHFYYPGKNPYWTNDLELVA